MESNQNTELKDPSKGSINELNENSTLNKSPISQRKFEHAGQVFEGGSSPVLGWFLDDDGQKWIGKCSMLTLTYGDFAGVNYYVPCNFDEFKECLANRLYTLFGVKTPETTLSIQNLSQKDQQNYFEQGFDNLDKPRMHLMSKFISGFQTLGANFLSEYQQSAPNKSNFCPKQENNLPLKGFGRVIVTAVLLHDFDCIGNSGGNMGYIIDEEQKCFQVVKIDPGEALPFATDMSSAQDLATNDPKKKEAILGTGGSRLPYSALRSDDQKEFIQTAMEILEMPDSKIKEVFEDFLGFDKRFEIILEHLLERKQDLLNAFELEVRLMILNQIEEIKRPRAAMLMRDWGKPNQQPLEQDSVINPKLILNSSRLDAINIARNQLFVGRKSELHAINDLFTNSEYSVTGCAIVGGAGLGKSHLAAEYINQYKHLYSQVIRLNAEYNDLIADQILIYLQTCFKVPNFDLQEKSKSKIIERLHKTLNKCPNSALGSNKKKFCIIFDNAANMSQIQEYLPDQGIFPELNIDILVTSRYQIWEKPFYTKIEMQTFGVEETQSYIKQCLLSVQVESDQISKDAYRLNALLGGLPLAVSQAIAYIQQKEISISEFCDLVNEVNQKDGTMVGEAGKGAKDLNFVSSILTLALAELRFKNQNVESILGLLAYLSPEDINERILRRFWEQLFPKSKNDDFYEALKLLGSYSIVTLRPYQIDQSQVQEKINPVNEATDYLQIKIHELTQQVIRLSHQESSIYDNRYQIVFFLVFLELKFNYKDMEDVHRAGLFVLHGMGLEKLPNKTEDKWKADLFDRIGHHQQITGKYDVALKYFEKALAIKEGLYGQDHPQTGRALFEVGKIWGNLGKYEKERDLLTQALEILENHEKDHSCEIGVILNYLGTAWGFLGNYEKQKDFCTRALEIFENNYRNDSPEISAGLNSLAQVHNSLGEHDKEKDILIRALEIAENHFGKDHPNVAAVVDSLGGAWGSLGYHEKKKDLLIRSLEITEKNFGKEHPKTGISLTNLGGALGALGEYEKQREYLTRALKIFENHFGKNHLQTGITLENLAAAYGSIRDFEKQKDLFTQALEIFENHYGKGHSETGSLLAHLGNAWGDLGDHEKKRNLLIQALEIFESHYGKEHIKTGTVLESLGIAYEALGHYEEQKEFLTRALKIKVTHYGKYDPKTATTLGNLAIAWGKLDNHEKEKDLLTRALEIFENSCQKDQSQIGAALCNLGTAWGSLGNHEKKKELLIRAVEIFENCYGTDHLQTGNALFNLGIAWGSLGNNKKKKEILTRALKIFDKNYPSNHPNISQVKSELFNLDLADDFLNKYSKNPANQKEMMKNLFQMLDSAKGNDNPESGHTFQRFGMACVAFGEHEKAKDCLILALEIFEKHYGEDDPQTGKTLYDLGKIWGVLNNYENQKYFLTRALRNFEKNCPLNHPFISEIKTELSRLSPLTNSRDESSKFSANQPEMVREMITKLERCEKTYGKNDIETGKILLGLGIVWGLHNNFEKSIDPLNRALQIFEQNYGKDAPQTGKVIEKLSAAWAMLSNFEKAIHFCTRALNIYQKNYPPNHPEISQTKEVLNRINQLASQYSTSSANQETISRLHHWMQKLEKIENLYGKDHILTGEALLALGHKCGEELGNYEKQIDFMTRGLEIVERHYGTEHSKTGMPLYHIGMAWGYLAQYEKQIGFLTEALKRFEKDLLSNDTQITRTRATILLAERLNQLYHKN